MVGYEFSRRAVLELAIIALAIYFVARSQLSAGSAAQPEKPENIQLANLSQLVRPSLDLQCPKHEYRTHILAARPLVIYLDGFLSASEVEHLVSISQDKWVVSTVSNSGHEAVDESIRKSEKAAIDRDGVVQCIEQRALSLQGWPQAHFLERLWTQRYNSSGFYNLHYDFATSSKVARRVSSFLVYLKDECVGGGTSFPRLPMPKDQAWCHFLDCDNGQGVTFKPRAGSAIFWMNFDPDGRGYKETIHAGMPVESGQKIALNIWTWYQEGYKV